MLKTYSRMWEGIATLISTSANDSPLLVVSLEIVIDGLEIFIVQLVVIPLDDTVHRMAPSYKFTSTAMAFINATLQT